MVQECEVEESVSKNRWTEKENFLVEQELYGTTENFNLARQNQYPDARKFNQGYKIHPQEQYYQNSNIRYQENKYIDRSYNEGQNRRLNNTKRYNKEF